ncbi:MAG: hypothetical protein ABI972_13415 [Acidobacteriota bacterium]
MGIDALKDEILKLSEAEQAELRSWLMNREWDEWDREMAEDFSPGGRGEHLLSEVNKKVDAGDFAPLSKRKVGIDGD